MAYQAGTQKSKKSKPSYFYAILSITLVLFTLGVMGTILLFSQNLTQRIQEKIQVRVQMRDNLTETDILQFQKKLEREPFVREASYVSKEDAAKILQEEIGGDLDMLGYNPLPATVDFSVTAAYAHSDSLEMIKAKLKENAEVFDVAYSAYVADAINKNAQKLGYILLALTVILLIIALTLIDNTIRLVMYSNRFLIKSMQLVGATRWFIIKPFIMRGVFNGFISGLVAVILLVGALFYLQLQQPELVDTNDFVKFAGLFAGVIATGVIISWFSTWMAVRKYLKLRLDDLY